MHAMKILPQLMTSVLPAINAARLKVLTLSVAALLSGRRLTLMELARHWPDAETVRAPLKRLDRFLSNHKLLAEMPSIETSLARWLLQGSLPVVIVDWSELTRDGRWFVLRAGVPKGGRTLTLMERVYPAKSQNTPKAQKAFLNDLASIVPEGNPLLIVTDAGFRSDWFREVRKHGWHFLGRLRNNTQVQHGERPWIPCKSLYIKARSRVTDLGEARIVKGHPLPCRLILQARARRGRQRLGRHGRPIRNCGARKAQQREREPWLLVTSCCQQVHANQLCVFYGKRMQIEQSFRDLKSHRDGHCFEDSLTRKPNRLRVLLLVCTLATTFAWLIGRYVTLRSSLVSKVLASRRLAISTIRIGRQFILSTRTVPRLSVLFTLFRRPPDDELSNGTAR